MDLALTEAQTAVHREVGALARSFGWDYWRRKDQKAEYPTEFVGAFARAGWLGLAIPESPAPEAQTASSMRAASTIPSPAPP